MRTSQKRLSFLESDATFSFAFARIERAMGKMVERMEPPRPVQRHISSSPPATLLEESSSHIPSRRRSRTNNPRVTKVATPQTAKEAPLEVFGSVKQVFPSTTFAVELDNGHIVLAHIAGRLRRHHIKILPGDNVDVEISPYDLSKGRIVYRYRAGEARRT